jgi:hypothetical protein
MRVLFFCQSLASLHLAEILRHSIAVARRSRCGIKDLLGKGILVVNVHGVQKIQRVQGTKDAGYMVHGYRERRPHCSHSPWAGRRQRFAVEAWSQRRATSEAVTKEEQRWRCRPGTGGKESVQQSLQATCIVSVFKVNLKHRPPMLILPRKPCLWHHDMRAGTKHATIYHTK